MIEREPFREHSPFAPLREPLLCCDCGDELERRIGRQGRQRKRCDACLVAHGREYQRAYQAERRARLKAATLPDRGPCPCGCGTEVRRGQRCPEAAAEQADYDKTRP